MINQGVPAAATQSPVGHCLLAESQDREFDAFVPKASNPEQSTSVFFHRGIPRMKIDIHNHILPKKWPDLKQVGTERHNLMEDLEHPE